MPRGAAAAAGAAPGGFPPCRNSVRWETENNTPGGTTTPTLAAATAAAPAAAYAYAAAAAAW